MSQELLGPESRSVKGAAPKKAFTLWNILEEFKCPFKPNKLHNIGNDATYSLHAILMLTLRNPEGREPTVFEKANLEQLH